MKFEHGDESDNGKPEAQGRNIFSGFQIQNITMSNSVQLSVHLSMG